MRAAASPASPDSPDDADARLLPTPNDLSEPFWSALGEGRLRMPACAECGHRFFPPRPACPTCLHQELDWLDASGEGEVYSVTVVHRRPAPGFTVPFALALVELDDGWTLMTHVVDCPADDVHVGSRVEIDPRPITGRDGRVLWLPLFRLLP